MQERSKIHADACTCFICDAEAESGALEISKMTPSFCMCECVWGIMQSIAVQVIYAFL